MIPYMHAIQFTLQNEIPESEFNEYTIMYSICSVYKHSVQEVFKKTNNRSGKEQYLTFRRKIFSAYFMTNLFDSLDDHGFLETV